MGASASVSSSDIITRAVNSISNEVVQKAVSSSDQNVAINVSSASGDVNISGLKINQEIQVKTTALFKSLTSSENMNKVHEEIAKRTQSILSGLNLGQVSVATSTISSVIENCINIFNRGVAECSVNTSQDVRINVDKTQGNVNITDTSINQVTKSLTQCIMSSANNARLISDTDNKIKQLTMSSAEGIDVKWIAIAGVAALAVFGATSVRSLNKIVGPLMILGGIYAGYLGYMEGEYKQAHSVSYILNDLDKVATTLHRIKTEAITRNDDAFSHGEADVYETFGGNVTLYTGVLSEDIRNQLTPDLLDIQIDETYLHVSVRGSQKYKRIEFVLPMKIDNYVLGKAYNETTKASNTVYIETVDFEYNHKLKISYTEKDPNKVEFLQNYYFEPTVITVKQKREFIDILKRPMVLVGCALVVTGLVVSIVLQKKKE